MKTQIKKILHLALLTLWLIPVLCQAQGIELTTGGSIACTATATIEINNGSFINNGTYTKGTETFTMSGATTPRSISGISLSDFYNLTLTNTGGVSIAYNAKVTVSNTLTNTAGNTGLILKSTASGTASLIESTPNVSATVERYITGAAEAWHLLSSPVASQAISGDFTPAGTYTGGFGYDFYAWNEPSQTWLNQKVGANDITSFIPGKGYLVAYQAANPTKSFAGALNTGSYNFPMTVSATGTYEHSNLAGNPYPSSIDWKAASGLDKTKVVVESGGGHNLYIWNQTANNYGVYNDINSGDNGTNSVTRYIPPMQGFFVVASAAGNLVMDNGARVHSTQAFLKSDNDNGFRLLVNAPDENGSDEILLDFGHATSTGGAEKWNSFVPTAPGLYSPKDGNNFSISFLSSVSDNPVVPVNFKAGANGSYSLNALFNSSAFATANLEDKQTGIIYDLRLNPLYTFDATTADDENRFNLHFTTVGINETEAEAAPLIYSYEKTVYISSKVTSDAEVFVRNITGQLLKKTSISGTTSAIELSALPVGVYVVSVADAQGIYSAKVILK
ncbi:MAG: T9SS type A sorting domain-containing protein [Lentimicrobium sp.]|nr:T9SS type A sorting domain-containing protein [Lentimicrobium sp.]